MVKQTTLVAKVKESFILEVHPSTLSPFYGDFLPPDKSFGDIYLNSNSQEFPLLNLYFWDVHLLNLSLLRANFPSHFFSSTLQGKDKDLDPKG